MERINLSCSGCGQTLATDSQSAGKQVRCPKCQTILNVPTTRSAGSAATKVKQPATRSPRSADSTVIACGSCKKKLSVKLLDKPSTVVCPGCQSTLRLPVRKSHSNQPAKQPNRPTPQSAVSRSATQSVDRGSSARHPTRPAVKSSAKSSPVQSSPVQRPIPSGADSPSGTGGTGKTAAAAFASPPNDSPLDFSAADSSTGGFASDAFTASGQSPSGSQFGSPFNAGGFPASAGPPQRMGIPAAAGSSGFAAWLLSHKTVVAVAALTLLSLLIGIFNPPTLIMTGIHFPIALIVIGGLFLPRQHMVDKVMGAVGAQAAGYGAGGIALLLLAFFAKVGSRIFRRSQRQGSGDLSNVFDASVVTGIVTALVIMAVGIAVTVYLWKRIGIFRTLAYGYIAEMSLLCGILLLGTVAQAKHDSDVARRRADMEAQMRQMEEESLARIERSRSGRATRRPGNGYRPPSGSFIQAEPGQVLVTVTHTPGLAIESTLDQLSGLSEVGDIERRAKTMGQSLLVVDFDGDPQALADKIDFARVLLVNRRHRSIRLHVR